MGHAVKEAFEIGTVEQGIPESGCIDGRTLG